MCYPFSQRVFHWLTKHVSCLFLLCQEMNDILNNWLSCNVPLYRKEIY